MESLMEVSPLYFNLRSKAAKQHQLQSAADLTFRLPWNSPFEAEMDSTAVYNSTQQQDSLNAFSTRSR
jgi:hypothetical protein